MDIFINKAITNGIEAYNNKNAGKDYSSSHYYELTIIEILTRIYDRVSIIIPYKTKYEKMIVGTTENCIPFYVKQGFDKYEKTVKNFGEDNYDEKIRNENAICIDKYYYSKNLNNKQ